MFARVLIAVVLVALVWAVAARSSSGAGEPRLHVDKPGETLWSIAAASNLTTRTVAAFNGLSEDAHVVLGQTIMVPSVAEGAAALAAGSDATPTELARRVASPGGTTEAGLKVLDSEDGLKPLMLRTLDASRRREAELAAAARRG